MLQPADQTYLFSSIKVLVKKMETANVKINFGVWLLNSQENLKCFGEILSVDASYRLIPLAQSVHKRHVGRLGVN